jgi:hypothetical protein
MNGRSAKLLKKTLKQTAVSGPGRPRKASKFADDDEFTLEP